MKQTAVEWFTERIQSNIIFSFEKVLEQAKQLEKQQIIDARVNGVCEGIDIGSNPVIEDISKNHEIYYNKTFKNK